MPVSFSQFFSEEDFNKYFGDEAIEAHPHHNDGKYEEDGAFIQELILINLTISQTRNGPSPIENNIIDFFIEKNNHNELFPVENLEGHKIRFPEMWNLFINTKSIGNKSWDRDHHFYLFGQIIILIADRFSRDENYNKKSPITYKQFINLIDSGTSPSFSFRSLERFYCSKDDTYYDAIINNWKLVLPKLQSLANSKMQSIDIEFKTGNLVINDFFRNNNNSLKKFQEEKVDEYAEGMASINSEKGRIQTTKQTYEKCGFVFVEVSNTCPSVFQKENTLIFGSGKTNYDFETNEEYISYASKYEFEAKGTVCTDLWWTTIIEEEQLQEIMEQNIEEILKENHRAFRLKVEPGKYRLCFSGNYVNFNKQSRGKFTFEKQIKPYFALEKIT